MAALFGGMLVLGGCATRADFVQVKRDQRDMRALLADQQVAIDGLRRRIDALRAELGESGRRPAAPSGERLAELEARLAAMEQRPVRTPIPEVVETPVPLTGEPLPPDAMPTPLPTRTPNPLEAALARDEGQAGAPAEYREALQTMRQGQCSQAVPKLRDFIRKNPKSDLTDNAQYWIGNCYYSQRDYNRAIIELNEVLLKYPKGDKVPAALLTLADAFADSGDRIDARLILQKLVAEYPRSEEAERGRQRLQALGD